MQTESMRFFEQSEIKNLENVLNKNYGAAFDLSNFIVIQTAEEKIWLSSLEIKNIPLEKVALNSVGMYFGKMKRNEKMHLSIEGCQLLGKEITKNVIEVNRETAEKFMRGENIEITETTGCDPHNFVVIKSGSEYVGSGLLVEGHVENLTPKSRRMPL